MKLNFKISRMAMAILLSLSVRTLTASEMEWQIEEEHKKAVSYISKCSKPHALEFIASDPNYIKSIKLYRDFNEFISYGVVTRILDTYSASQTTDGLITRDEIVDYFSNPQILSYFKKQYEKHTG